jgi:phosphonate transport system substrate-binding protein
VLSFLLSSAAIAAAGQKEIRFAITSAVASDPSYSAYRELTNYLAGKVGMKSVFISDLSYSQVDNLFVSGRADVGFLCNAHFARRKNKVKFDAVAAPVIMGYGKPKFQLYYIVRKDSSIKSIDDLKGKTVDLADPLSTTTIYAAYMLQRKGETINSFFRKAIYSGSHDMTIELVANGMVDAGVVDGHIWDFHDKTDPGHTSKTRIIYKSEDFTIPPVVVAKTVPKDLKVKIRKALLEMNGDSEGRRILSRLRIEKFVDIRNSDYDDVLRIYDKVKSRI